MNEFEGIENMSRSGACATKSCYTAMQILKDNSEGLSSKKLIEFISTRVEFDDWEKETYESTGQTRWKTIFYFYSIDLEKAGFIIKQKGTWFNTPEGEEVIKKGAV
ncbi:MAG: winged helix-turn-helix domain-containing protein, partial [Caldisericia bacterium]|nr:winged helix-turn-helix domain-containing protein [Caldisericia bacterium]